MNFLKDYPSPETKIENIYCFLHGRVEVLDAKILGVLGVNRATGEIMTCKGFLPWHKYWNCKWFDSEENLRKYGIEFWI
jgi:hypothetical protein